MLQYLLTLISTKLPKSEKGQDLAEYGLLVAVIALVVMIAAVLFGDNLYNFFNYLATQVAGWMTPAAP